jgi:hypothetical protein
VTSIQTEWSYQGSGGTLRRWYIYYDVGSPSGKMVRITDPGYNVVGSPTYQKNRTFTWTSYTRSDGAVIPLLQTAKDPRGVIP